MIQWLAVELGEIEGPAPIPTGETYPLWSPDRAYDAAAVLMRALDAEGRGP